MHAPYLQLGYLERFVRLYMRSQRTPLSFHSCKHAAAVAGNPVIRNQECWGLKGGDGGIRNSCHDVKKSTTQGVLTNHNSVTTDVCTVNNCEVSAGNLHDQDSHK
jgi:hypothetical protein